MLSRLNPDAFVGAPLCDRDIRCNEAYLQVFDCQNGSKCTILQSSSGWKYQLLNVIKSSIFGIVVRGQVVASPASVSSHFKETQMKIHDNMVAIKMYSKRKMEDAFLGNLKEDPIAEISILQNLQEAHPHVLNQLECCADNENIYSIMPLLPGSELFDVVVDQGCLTELQAKVVFRQIVEGLNSLHQQGVAHQDMSLENILYDTERQSAVIIDFGLSVHAPQRNMPVVNNRAGKMFYMSPEMINGKPLIDPFASDVWSLGICLLYMLIGFPPIEHACDDDVRYQFVRDGRLAELLSHWNISLSSPVLQLLQGLLQVNPSERMSLSSILNHSWVQEKQFSSEVLPASVDALSIYSFVHESSKLESIKG